ncbi:GerAB/ArcD/ProY family transporter [Alkalihalobacillus sp. LMS39]|uniref:GerAB/ArcD/ProY family transporter n=1 Tax=Alkalihalobacillus sp. LMS39 TaxID=2924032 RepID=UPI001FB561E2|nr:GerAB/ArcD/ProY family transporter [Alkalihalobacillus sp. LMS39]UOE92397.1 spore germination protein [Alkalihalobacillus sp. LMS39]
MNKSIKDQYLVSDFMVFFLIHSMQIGVGILGFQRMVVKSSGYDGWISVLIAGACIHIFIWMMYKVLSMDKGDVISIHKDLFGKWIGNLLSLLLLFYFLLLALTVLRSYIEVVQVWVFPELPTVVMSLFIVIVMYFIVSGGFRAVTGFCVISFFLTLPLFILLLFPLEFANWINLLPVWKHTILELVVGAKETVISFLGFELLLLYYPFIKKAKHSQRWAQLGAFVTTVVYTGIMFVSLSFFSEEQLNRTIWATLTMFKVVELPFIERVEYIGISMWLVLVAPNIALAIWGATRAGKQIFGVNQRILLMLMLAFVFILSLLFEDRNSILQLQQFLAYCGLVVLLGYLPFLFLSHLLISKVRKNNESSQAM